MNGRPRGPSSIAAKKALHRERVPMSVCLSLSDISLLILLCRIFFKIGIRIIHKL
jgi:hypothetical protein